MRKLSLLLTIILFTYFSNTVTSSSDSEFTQGRLDVYTKKGKSLGQSPLKHTKVKTEISGFLARVNVEQEFENNFDQPIEAVYIFPLSQNSAVDKMTMKIGARTILGQIKQRDEARKIYETAKSEGKTASLLDQERANVFTQSVANIMPGETIIIEISYVETLKYQNGSYEFVFPMVVAPRYSPKSMSKDAAAQVTPPVSKTRAGQDISIDVDLDAGVPVENISSTLHEISSEKLNANSAKISLKQEDTIPNRDFVLKYDIAGKKIEDAILAHRDERGGFFTMMLSPPKEIKVKDVTSKEIIFVLDTSGSMSGFPIEKAKEAMKMSLEGLYPNDTFNLITFAGDTHVLFEKPVIATQANMERAQKFLESRSGSGGTEMMKAIEAAFKDSDSTDHIRIVNFMTDGLIGNESQIIAEIQKHPNARVFSFGIGDSVNRFLLDKMSKEGCGEVEYVTLKDDGSAAAKRFYERIRNPVLTDITIDWNGLPVEDVYPKRITDLFDAKPVVINGRYTKEAKGTIKLRGKAGGKDYEREIKIDLPREEEKHDVFATLWARQKIDELMSQNYDFENEEANAKSENVKSITQIGLDYRLMTQYTSFVAVEEVVRNEGGKSVRVEVPVDLANGAFGDESSEEFGNSPHGYVIQGFIGRRSTAGSVPNSPANVTAVTLAGGGGGGGKEVATGSGRGTGEGNGIGSGSGGGTALRSRRTKSAPPPVPTSKPNASGPTRGVMIISKPRASYPKDPGQLEFQGTIALRVTFLASGQIGDIAPAMNLPNNFIEMAILAAKKIQFSPAMKNGQPITVTKIVRYSFTNGIRTEEPDSNKQPDTSKIELLRQNRFEKFHIWIFDLVDRRQKSGLDLLERDQLFVSGNKASVQIMYTGKSESALQKLRSAGFELAETQDRKDILFGIIEISKLDELANITEVKYILPSIN